MERGIFVPMMIPAFPDNPCGGGGAGTVTSVGITAPAIFAVTNSPVTTTGVIDLALVAQSPNLVFASPTTGAPAAPTFRTLVAADLGTGTATVNTVLRGDLTWGDATAIVGWTPSLNTSSPNNTVNASRLLVNSTSVNGDAVIQPKGTGALLAQLPDGLTTGGDKRGTYAIDLQLRRAASTDVASGSESVVIGTYNSATGTNSLAIGVLNEALAQSAFAFGRNNNANISQSFAIGRDNISNNSDAYTFGVTNTASGQSSMVIGFENTTNGQLSTAFGFRSATPNTYGSSAWASGRFSSTGDAQMERYLSRMVIGGAITDELTTDGLGGSATNRILIPNDTTCMFTVRIVARRTDADNESAAWEFKGCIDNNAGTTDFVGCPTQTVIADDSSGAWVVSVNADNTNDALTITATGVAGKTIRFLAYTEIVKITG